MVDGMFDNKLYQKLYHADHRAQRNADSKTRVKRRREAARQWIMSYLRGRACVDCGIAVLLVLQFDHRRGRKVMDISKMVKAGRDAVVLASEVAKCDVVCANCHARRTARDQGSFRLRKRW